MKPLALRLHQFPKHSNHNIKGMNIKTLRFWVNTAVHADLTESLNQLWICMQFLLKLKAFTIINGIQNHHVPKHWRWGSKIITHYTLSHESMPSWDMLDYWMENDMPSWMKLFNMQKNVTLVHFSSLEVLLLWLHCTLPFIKFPMNLVIKMEHIWMWLASLNHEVGYHLSNWKQQTI